MKELCYLFLLSPYDIHVFKRLICTPNSLCQKFRGFQFYVTFNLYAVLKIQAYRDITIVFVRILLSLNNDDLDRVICPLPHHYPVGGELCLTRGGNILHAAKRIVSSRVAILRFDGSLSASTLGALERAILLKS